MGKRTTRVKGISFAAESDEISELEEEVPDNEAVEEERIEVAAPKRDKKNKKNVPAAEVVGDEETEPKRATKKQTKESFVCTDALESEVKGDSKEKKHKKTKHPVDDEEELGVKTKKNKRTKAIEAPDEALMEEGLVDVSKKEKKKQKRQAHADLEDAEDAEPEKNEKKKKKMRPEHVDVEDEEDAEGEMTNDDDLAKKERTLYISGIPWSCDETALRKDFAKCGRIVKMNMPMNDQGKPRGIAFITFKSKVAIDEALKLDGIDYGGRKLSVKLADKAKGKGKAAAGKDGSQKDFEVFVCGLPFATEKAVLRKDFEECGEIVSLNMLVKPDGSCRGVAFITFKDMEGVKKACEYNGTEYGGRWIQVEKSGEAKGAAKSKTGSSKGEGKHGKQQDRDTESSKHQDKGTESNAIGKRHTFDSDSEDDD